MLLTWKILIVDARFDVCGVESVVLLVNHSLTTISSLYLKLHLTGASPILERMVDCRSSAWATSFVTRTWQVENIVLSLGQVKNVVLSLGQVEIAVLSLGQVENAVTCRWEKRLLLYPHIYKWKPNLRTNQSETLLPRCDFNNHVLYCSDHNCTKNVQCNVH